MELKEYIIEKRRHIHKNPEIGFFTYETASFVKKELDNLGYETSFALNKASVIAKLDIKKKKTIAFRADMDALKICEKTELEYKSNNGFMHACGHDAHTAILLGTAKLLMENKDILPNNIVLIFQCAEEGPLPGGAYSLLRENLLPHIDEIYALHVSNDYLTGEIAIKDEEAFSGADWYEFRVKGKGGHGSTPEKANNPNIAIAHLILMINDYIENLRKNTKCAFTTCKIASGQNYNVIPDEAYILGTIRFFNEKTRNLIHNEAINIANKIEKKYNVTVTFNHLYGYIPLFNNPDAVKKVINVAKQTNLFNNVIKLAYPTMVAEDFAYYLEKYKGAIFFLGVREKDKLPISLHSADFTLDENALENAAKFFFNLAMQ